MYFSNFSSSTLAKFSSLPVESVSYTAFNKVNDVEQTLDGITKKMEFTYGANYARKISRLYESGVKKETNYYTNSENRGTKKHGL
ncbi:hypothetical protein [Ancylomarina longa]|uniref:hypothetical protein n=1 Tax=Ancylomarina longa TaxID=2487017 RepID=UPI000FCBDAE4|nr:hypothetical protein [Ancylomarina longa]